MPAADINIRMSACAVPDNPSNNSSHPGTSPLRVGCVSYLNSKPLIYSLDQEKQIDLQLQVPAQLIEGLSENCPPEKRYHAALLPTIDYQRLPDLRIIPSGGICCDGPTLTVRIFSSEPIATMQSLACDIESHTSVALARIVLAEMYGLHPQFVPMPAGDTSSSPRQAQLLIGDKVVCNEPPNKPHQLDLGGAWKELTGLPFVFAVWTAAPRVDLRDLPQRLTFARQQGMQHIDQIITQHAVPRGWPAPLAHQYLTEYLKYEIGPRQIQAIQRFHELALKHGIIAQRQPLRIVE